MHLDPNTKIRTKKLLLVSSVQTSNKDYMLFLSGCGYLLYKYLDFDFEGKRKDTSLVITRSFQYFCEYRRQL